MYIYILNIITIYIYSKYNKYNIYIYIYISLLVPLTSAHKLPRGEIFRPPNASMPRLVTLVTRIEVATEHSWLKPGRKGSISEETWVDKIPMVPQ